MKQALLSMSECALQRLRELPPPHNFETFRNGIAFYDTQRDGYFTNLPNFSAAVATVESHPRFSMQAEIGDGKRIALQFIYTLFGNQTHMNFDIDNFNRVFTSLELELGRDEWTYTGIANIQNFTSSSAIIELGDGVTIRVRDFRTLSDLLHCNRDDLTAFLTDDWMQGAHGSHVLIVELKEQKRPDNLMLSATGKELSKAQTALLTLRLLKPGDIRIGRLFLLRQAEFNVGIGGRSFSGFTIMNPGQNYNLEVSEIDQFRQMYDLIATFQSQYAAKWANIKVALRSFSSIYDRTLQQAEDRILDSITALEAVFAINTELSFRLAFLTASLLSIGDDERVVIFREIRNYYKVRNAIVHGEELTREERMAIQNDQSLQHCVRRLLGGMLKLAVSETFPNSHKLKEALETISLHSKRLKELQDKMGLGQSS